MDAPLILIASYPKSGNTWTRVVLHGLLDAASAGELNALNADLYGGSKRALFDEYAPAEMADLSAEQIDDLLPEMYRSAIAPSAAPILLKTHERLRQNRAGEWVVPTDRVRCVICVVRHPFDVAASFAHHMGYTAEEVIAHMGSPFWFAPQVTEASFAPPEFVDTWSRNVLSWMENSSPYRTLVLRYEDLLEDDEAGFRRVADAAGVPYTEALLQDVVAKARFDKLQAKEQQEGFRERPRTSSHFFRSGKSMSWVDFLPDSARQRVVQDHGELMSHFGYNDDGTTTKVSTY